MPIFDQGYQHWDGVLSGHSWRWLAMARRGVRTQVKNRWTRMVLLLAWLPALALGLFLALWGLLEQKTDDWRGPSSRSCRRPSWSTRRSSGGEVWTLAFSMFLSAETFAAMILVLIVGPNLISQDLRFNAMPLYLSRPLTRFDYFAGKLGTIAAFLAAVMIVPVVLTYLLGVAFSLSFRVIADTWWIVPASVAYGLVVVFVGGLFMLAISSLSRKSLYVAATWIGIWMVGSFVAPVLSEGLGHRWGPIVSVTNDLARVREAMLGSGEAYETIQDATQQATSSIGRASAFLNPFAKPGPPHRHERKPHPPREPDDPRGRNPFEQNFPWQWSAYVLLGMAGLSLWILTTRVKSLDRLR